MKRRVMTTCSFEEVNAEVAARWLLANEHDPDEGMPTVIKTSIAALEVK